MRRFGLFLLALLLTFGMGVGGVQTRIPAVESCCCGEAPAPDPCPCGPAQCPSNSRPATPSAGHVVASGRQETPVAPQARRVEARPWNGLPDDLVPPSLKKTFAISGHTVFFSPFGSPPGPLLDLICTLRK